jgi:hypothetical protein
MMSYSIEQLTDDPIVIVTLHEDFDFKLEGEQSTLEAIALLDSLDESVYYISDISAAQFDFEDTIMGSNMAARGENPLFHHRNVKQVLLVVGDVMQEMSAEGMQSDVYGNVNIRAFHNIDDALAHARSGE